MVRLVLFIVVLLTAVTDAGDINTKDWQYERDCRIIPMPWHSSAVWGNAVIDGCTGVIKNKRTSRAKKAIAYLHRGKAYYQKAQYAWAIDDLKKAAKLSPKNAEAHYFLGLCYFETSERHYGIYVLKHAIKLDPEFVEAYYALGRAYEYEGNSNRSAKRNYRKVLELRPGHEKAKEAQRLAREWKPKK